MKDSDVIDAFVEHLRQRGFSGLTVDSRPDQENRNTPDVDAIAGPYAIEHTRIESFKDQYRDGHYFSRVVEEIEDEFKGELSFSLSIAIDHNAFTKGQDWSRIQSAIRDWIREHAISLPEVHRLHVQLSDVPFVLIVSKRKDLNCGLWFLRHEPDEYLLAERIRAQAALKARKLETYRNEGKTTVLLLESDDIALMNVVRFEQAYRIAWSDLPPKGVDEVWYVDSSVPEHIHFRKLVGRGELLDRGY